MDGRVLEELFEPAFIARNPVQVGVSEALDEGNAISIPLKKRP